MKKIRILMILTLLMLALASCGKSGSELNEPDDDIGEELEEPEKKEKKTKKQKKEKENDPEEPKEESEGGHVEVNYSAMYKPVFDEVLGVIEYGYNMDKEYDYVSGGLSEKVMYNDDEDLMETIGYYIEDISGDGVPELLIGCDEDYYGDGESKSFIYSAFTLDDDDIINTFSGAARSSYNYLGDGHFYYFGSGGASITIFGENHISEDGWEVIWDDFYFTDEKDDGTVGKFYNTTGVFDIDEAEELQISDRQFLRKMDDYEERCEMIPWEPVGGYLNSISRIKRKANSETGLTEKDAAKIADNIGGTVCALECHDYDGNGTNEAFVVIGEDDEYGGYYPDAVWFIADDGTTKVMRTDFDDMSMYSDESGYYVYNPSENVGFFSAECGGYGSGWLNFIFGVKDGRPYEPDLSMNTEGFYIDQYDEFYTLTDNFDDGHKYMITELEYDRKTGQFRKGRVTEENWGDW
ncbi:MAG: hypothetical protein K6F34_02340 [Lachnospiraceae bacterium]|nr:hypothetical protein [Lachnospiraceae bacterium]